MAVLRVERGFREGASGRGFERAFVFLRAGFEKGGGVEFLGDVSDVGI